MDQSASALFRLFLLFAIATLTACGGGGGGGSSSSASAANIDESNALNIAQEAWANSELDDGFAGSLGDGFVSAVSLSDAEMLATLELAAKIARTVAPGLFPQQTISASATETIFCDAGGSVEISVNDAGTEVTANFNSCRGLGGEAILADSLINGRIRISLLSDASQDSLDIRLEFTDFRVSFDGQDVTIDGDFREQFEEQFNVTQVDDYFFERVRLIVEDLAVQLDNRFRRLTDYDLLNEERYPLDGGGSELLDFRGVLEIPRFGGTVSFDTVVPFIYDWEIDGYTQGVFRIEGADGALIRIAVIEGTEEVRVRIDTDGDGEFDFEPAWGWSEIEDFEPVF